MVADEFDDEKAYMPPPEYESVEHVVLNGIVVALLPNMTYCIRLDLGGGESIDMLQVSEFLLTPGHTAGGGDGDGDHSKPSPFALERIRSIGHGALVSKLPMNSAYTEVGDLDAQVMTKWKSASESCGINLGAPTTVRIPGW